MTGGTLLRARALHGMRQHGLLKTAGCRNAAEKALRRKKKVRGLGRIVALSVIPVTCTFLGNWQWRRMKQKDKLIAVDKEEQKKPPVDMPVDFSQLNEMEWKKVRVRGVFDHSREQYVGPRPLLKAPEIETPVTYSGYIVLTPFRCSHNGKWIVVNRGWVGRGNKNPMFRMEGQVEGEVEIVAKVRKGETMGKKEAKSVGVRVWQFKDIRVLSEYLKTEPVLVDVTIDSGVPGGPIGGQTPAHLNNKHLEYVITWYGIAIVTGLFVLSMTRSYMQRMARQRAYLKAKEATANNAQVLKGGTDQGTPV